MVFYSKKTRQKQAKRKATAALVFGILSLVAVPILSPLGILGITKSSKAKKLGFKSRRGKAGFILSIIGLAIGGIVITLMILERTPLGQKWGLNQLLSKISSIDLNSDSDDEGGWL